MELNLNSNVFINNYADNGGAIYFGNEISNTDNMDYPPININNNIFKENKAERFGGAIYSNLHKLGQAIVNDNQIVYNEAGIFGGGIYSPNVSINETLFDIAKNEIENNTVASFIDNYSSKPSYIMLNSNKTISVYVGEYIPLMFSLYDDFDNIIIDITKYYSFLSLKLVIMENDSIDIDNSYILGNVGSFIKGIYNNIFNKNKIIFLKKY